METAASRLHKKQSIVSGLFRRREFAPAISGRNSHAPKGLLIAEEFKDWESTGGDEWPLVVALLEAMLPVVMANPRQVRTFAHTTGLLAKTGISEAQVLARFAETVRIGV
jgi:transposase